MKTPASWRSTFQRSLDTRIMRERAPHRLQDHLDCLSCQQRTSSTPSYEMRKPVSRWLRYSRSIHSLAATRTNSWVWLGELEYQGCKWWRKERPPLWCSFRHCKAWLVGSTRYSLSQILNCRCSQAIRRRLRWQCYSPRWRRCQAISQF